ncbi:MAG: hypothetical protein ACREQD_11385, partial [Candidatus Binataceae bacterium]
VFIRSIATRGHLGGMSETIHWTIDVMDAAGRDVVIVETVGTGQSEVEVAEIADVCVVVNAPGLGDDVQAIKAGLLEIADGWSTRPIRLWPISPQGNFKAC